MASSTVEPLPSDLPRRVFPLDTLLAAVAGVGFAWLALPFAFSTHWVVRLVVALACAAVAGGVLMAASIRRDRDRKLAFRCIEVLCRLDAGDLHQENLSVVLPKLAPGNPWHGVFSRIRECLVQYSQRLQAAEAARASAEVRYKRVLQERDQVAGILNSLAEPVLAIDEYNELYMVNPSAAELFRVELGEDGKGSRPLEQVIGSRELLEMLRDASQRKLPTQRLGEVEVVDLDGQSHWYRATCRGIALGNDAQQKRAHGVVAVLSDISDRKTLQKRNAEFVANASHEMKTPLSSIRAYVELLEDGDVEDEQTQEEFLGVISGQAERLQRLIDNLLNLARIEAGVVEVQKSNHSLNELLEEAFSVVQPTAEQKEIQLVKDLSPMYLGVFGDRDMLLQSAINLLSNAIKYTRPGGTVKLRSRLEDAQVMFEVEDTGVGLSMEDCGRVFEKFYRVKKDASMASGTGLGLPLAKHIVDDVHGGKLSVSSKLGEGSTFQVALPSIGRLGQ